MDDGFFSRLPAGRERRWEEAATRREIARRLLQIKEAGLSWRLSYSKLSDYVVESLGISARGAQELMRTERALSGLPLTQRAYDGGEIGSEHLRLLARAVSGSTEAEWVDAAKGLTVQGLALRLAAKSPGEDSHEGNAASLEAEPAQPIDIDAPVYFKTFWRESVSFARELAAQRLTPGECLKDVLAEFANLVPWGEMHPDDEEIRSESAFALAPELASGERPVDRVHGSAPTEDTGDQRNAGSQPGAPAEPAHGSARTKEAAEAVDRINGGFQPAGPRPSVQDTAQEAATRPQGSAASQIDCLLDARAIDEALRALVTRRHRREAAMGAHLREMARTRRYQEIHYDTLEAYAREHLDIGRRQMFYLLALERALAELPLLRKRFFDGRLTMKQALAVGRVATPETLPAWIDRAKCTTLRRLEDEIDHWRQLRETRPRVWALLKGLPLPDGTRLTEGEFAQVGDSAGTDGSAAEESRVHGSAQPAAAISPRQLSEAVATDEAADPLPQRTTRIRIWVSKDVMRAWGDAVAHLRSVVSADLPEWGALALLLKEFWLVWDNAETRRQRRENPTLDRDRWRCQAPACSSMGSGKLQEHHIIFRSGGGGDDPRNLVTLCNAHHKMLHDGLIRVDGEAPDNLTWEMGIEPGRRPYRTYRGHTRVDRAA